MRDGRDYGTVEFGVVTVRQMIGQLRYLEGKTDGIRHGIPESEDERMTVGLGQLEAGIGHVRQRLDDALTFTLGLPREEG